MNRTRPPVDGVCTVCRRHVGVMSLVWDHCHDCGVERGWVCDDCNMALTEHLILHWDDASRYLATHTCTPRLFDHAANRMSRRPEPEGTRRVYIGNGSGDPRFVRVSTRPGMLTVEQLAAVLGVAAGTARDRVAGRRGRCAVRLGNAWFVHHADALNILRSDWNLP